MTDYLLEIQVNELKMQARKAPKPDNISIVIIMALDNRATEKYQVY